MTNKGIKNLERSLRWEKTRVEKAVQQQLFERASDITEALISRAMEGDVTAINSAFDRMFGKAKQQVDVEHTGTPIVFMPAVLMDKFSLSEKEEPKKIEEVGYTEVIKAPEEYTVEAVKKARKQNGRKV